MRFGKSDEAGNAPLALKCVPDRTYRTKAEISNYRVHNSANQRLVAQRIPVTARGLDQPFPGSLGDGAFQIE